MGVCAGSVYVLGFTLLHEHVEEQLRGRVLSALYTLVRFCLLLSITVGGFLSDGFNWLFSVLFDNELTGIVAMALPGVRGALGWREAYASRIGVAWIFAALTEEEFNESTRKIQF